MKKMNKEQVFGLIRHILTFVSVFLISKGIIPQTIVNEIITGIIVMGMIVWSWVDKSNRDLSIWMIFVRKGLTIAGAFLLSKGIIKDEMWQEIVAMSMTLVSIILSYISNQPVVEPTDADVK